MVLSRVPHAVPSHYLLPLSLLGRLPLLPLGCIIVEFLHHVQHLVLQKLIIQGEGIEMHLGEQEVVLELLEGPPRTEEAQDADTPCEGTKMIQGGLEVFQGHVGQEFRIEEVDIIDIWVCLYI